MKKLFTTVALLAGFASSHAQNIYGDLESWRNVPTSLESPYKWFGIDSLEQLAVFFYPDAVIKKQCYKTSDAHGGNFAAQLVTINQDSLGIVPGLLANAQFGFDQNNFDPNNPTASISYWGGTNVSQRIDAVTAWVKYAPRGADAASISVQAVLENAAHDNTDSVVGEGTVLIAQSQNSYMQVSAPITYINTTVIPDKIYIICASSTPNTAIYTPTDSSMLWVDDINMVGTNGIENVPLAAQAVTLFPNPSSGIVNIASSLNNQITITLYSLSGQIAATKSFKGNASLDLAFLPRGAYVYDVKDEQGKLLQRGKLSLSK